MTVGAMKPTLAILADHPVQHFCPLYKELALSESVRTVVIFANLKGADSYFDKDFKKNISWGNALLESFCYKTLNLSDHSTFAQVWKSLSPVLDEVRPDVLFVYGYSVPISRAGIAWARLRGTSLVMNGDSELRRSRRFITRVAKKLILPLLFRQCDRFFTVGDSNEDYYLNYGVSRDKLIRTPFPIDSPIYDPALRNREDIRTAVRSQIHVVESASLILTVGKLIPRKGFDDLILAFERALEETKSCNSYLLIAGDGPERARLEALATRIAPNVRFLGFVSAAELPKYYVASDLYVHSSHSDPHPLAVSEAIYCGLPVIASDVIGSVGPTDDVCLGVNGWSYPCGDVAALAGILSEMMMSPMHLTKAREASLEIGRKHKPDTIAPIIAHTVLSLAR
jgi:glycosyltransferase involved in cell wall biosynthesis